MGGSYDSSGKWLPPEPTYGTVNETMEKGKALGVPGAETGANIAGAVSTGFAVGGPVGAVIMGATEAIKALGEGARAAISGTSQFAASMISADSSATSSVMATGAAFTSAGQAIGKISPIVGTVVETLGTFGTALGTVMQQMDGMVDRYAQYSPGLAVGQAQADITQQLGDFQRAQEATPALLEYLQARTDLQQKFEDMKIQFLEKITPAVTEGMAVIEGLMPLLNIAFTLIVESSKLLIAWLPKAPQREESHTTSIEELLSSEAAANLPTNQIRHRVNAGILEQYRRGQYESS
jgi:hypothetical protein